MQQQKAAIKEPTVFMIKAALYSCVGLKTFREKGLSVPPLQTCVDATLQT